MGRRRGRGLAGLWQPAGGAAAFHDAVLPALCDLDPAGAGHDTPSYYELDAAEITRRLEAAGGFGPAAAVSRPDPAAIVDRVATRVHGGWPREVQISLVNRIGGLLGTDPAAER